MNRAKEFAEVLSKKGLLVGAVRTVGGQPEIVGPTPWAGYRGDLEHRVGRPDLEGVRELLLAEGLPVDQYGPLTLWAVFRELGLMNGGPK